MSVGTCTAAVVTLLSAPTNIVPLLLVPSAPSLLMARECVIKVTVLNTLLSVSQEMVGGDNGGSGQNAL